MNRDNGIESVAFARKQGFRFEAVDYLLKTSISRRRSVMTLSPSARVQNMRGCLLPGASVRVGGKQVLETLPLAHDSLGSFGIRPQVGVGGFLFDFGQVFSEFAGVKDTPADRGAWFPMP